MDSVFLIVITLYAIVSIVFYEYLMTRIIIEKIDNDIKYFED